MNSRVQRAVEALEHALRHAASASIAVENARQQLREAIDEMKGKGHRGNGKSRLRATASGEIEIE